MVKSFANEDIEMRKFKKGNERFLATKRRSYLYMGTYQSVLNAMLTAVTMPAISEKVLMENATSIFLPIKLYELCSD